MGDGEWGVVWRPSCQESKGARETKKLDKFTRAYLEAALFTSNDDNDEPLDKNFSVSDFAPEAVKQAVKDCESFQDKYADLLSEAGDSEQNGYDFWLTRNGHGAGFWDRDYGEVGDALTRAAKAYGGTDAYVGDDDQLYFV